MKADTNPEKEALEWAIGYFRADPEDFKSGGRKRLQDLFLSGSLAEEDIGALVHSALFEGDTWASQTLRTLAAETIGRGELPGQSLRIFTEIFLRHPDMKWQLGAGTALIGKKLKGKPGPHANDRILRNSRIAHAMDRIVEAWPTIKATRDIKATRNAETKRKSAATIVMHALKEAGGPSLNEGTLNGIWDERHSLPIAYRLKK